MFDQLRNRVYVDATQTNSSCALDNLYFFLLMVNITGHPRIIHRDIKPSNILLDHDFEARVSKPFVLIFLMYVTVYSDVSLKYGFEVLILLPFRYLTLDLPN